MLTSAAAGDTSFWSEFSELEMDRYDDFNILSRSMAEISADVNEVLSQLEGFIGRSEGDIDEFTKLAHHLQMRLLRANGPDRHALFAIVAGRSRCGELDGKHVEMDLSGAKRNSITILFSRFPIRSSTGAHSVVTASNKVTDRVAQENHPRAISRCAPTTAATTFTSKSR